MSNINKKTIRKPVSKAKISTKYQVVIPKEIRAVVRDVVPNRNVYMTPINESTIQISLKPRNWAEEVRGIAKGKYGKDSDKYLKRLRSDWYKE